MSIFKCLGTTLSASDDIVDQLEQCVCQMYTKASYKDINKFCNNIFKSDMRQEQESMSYTTDNGTDLGPLLPFTMNLHLHIIQVNYQFLVWRQSHLAYADMPSPIGNILNSWLTFWQIINLRLQHIWWCKWWRCPQLVNRRIQHNFQYSWYNV